jgi:hypothetical protein
MWREFQATLDVRNQARDNLLGLLTFRTTAAADQIAQTTDEFDMEKASDFGLPMSARATAIPIFLGFNLDWFDVASRFSWRFLLDADADQVRAVHAAVLEADNRLVFKAAFGALFNPTQRINPEGLAVFPLWNADNQTPPPWAGMPFTGDHTHYLVSGSATVDGNDLVDLTRHIAHHGYGDTARGARIVVLCHPNDGEVLRGVVKGANSAMDFIPSSSAPAFLTAQTLIGERPPNSLGRLPIFGSIGNAWLSENALIPQGYLLAVAVAGENNASNVLALREHVRQEMQGLRQIPVDLAAPTIQDSLYRRGFGTGVRQRGAAAVMKVAAAGPYTPPAEYATVLA